ncbi:hypothetical protein E4K72_17810 [Oxalobacteraceae bacterium OM1]|nr:hypothetical protein E4K72_17810 [Oxalobacteraceae bacterium OM1]
MARATTITVDGAAHEVSDAFLSRILEVAVEGGCSYWADTEGEAREGTGTPNGARDFDLSDYVDDDDEHDDDGAPVYESASFLVSKDASQGGTLDLQGIADAIERILDGETDVPPAIREIIGAAVRDDDASDIDAEAADCIVQIGLFDELVYR